MKRFSLLVLLTLFLAACAPSQVATQPPVPGPATVLPTETATAFGSDADELTRLDEQGAVRVEIIPLNLTAATDTLDFDVSMNTHSVDLSMDLAALATLTTDGGVTVQAAKWDATPGGHHVRGTLIFPATQDGKSVLEGASKLTLTITNVDAPARVFEWELK